MFPFAIICLLIISIKAQNIEILSQNLIDNLRAHPKLIAEDELSATSKRFIDTQIESYIKLHSQDAELFTKRKRSLGDKLTKDAIGAYLLDEIEEFAIIPASFPRDISLFYQNSSLYAAALESESIQDDSNDLVIYKQHENGSFIEKSHTKVSKGVKIATHSAQNSTLIVIAENSTSKDDIHEKSGIYEFDFKEQLKKIQSIHITHASDVVFWEIHGETYMSIASFMSNSSGNVSYELDLPIYKYLGHHFDHVQSLKTKGAKRVTPFQIDHNYYLAVANFQDNSGKSQIYSEIYKFNYHDEKYEVHQRISTTACTDIRYFNFSQGDFTIDHFLIVANSFREDLNGTIDYETESIIYKFIDDYFIPFQSILINGIEEWIPLQGRNNELALFSLSKFDGINSFQYDGWSFVKTDQKMPQILKGRDITSLRSYNINNTSILVVSNRNNRGNLANMFKVKFNHHNFLNKIHNDLLTWCDSNFEKIQSIDVNFGDILLAQRSDIEEDEITTPNPDIDSINSRLEALNLELSTIEIEAEKSLQNDIAKEILKNLTANEILFNNHVFIREAYIDKINDFNAEDLVENSLNISEGFEINNLEFDLLKIENDFAPRFINNNPTDSIAHTYDDFRIKQFTINGDLKTHELLLDGALNGIPVTHQNLLLNNQRQIIEQPIVLKEMQVEHIEASNFNGVPLDSMLEQIDQTIDVDHIKNLHIKNLLIGGYINDVDIPALDKWTLKKNGDQEILADYNFDSLIGRNLESNSEIFNDLIPIDGGEYAIHQDLIIEQLLDVNDLHVLHFLSGINVANNSLDALLKNSNIEQTISGDKLFNNVRISNPIKLRGKIKSAELEKRNPFISIDHDIIIKGDKTITGNVTVNSIKANDVTTSDTLYSLKRLQEFGLKLTDSEIHPKLRFIQQINADEIFVDAINGIDVDNFVINGADDVQIIQGVKLFKGDLFVTGGTSVVKINNINVTDFENSVMTLDSDQIISGKVRIKNVVLDQISSNDTKFGTFNLDDLTAKTVEKSLVIDDNLESDVNITAKKIFIKGLLNDFDFNEIVRDTVIRDNTSHKITGRKLFENLTVKSLNTNEPLISADLDGLIDELILDEFVDLNRDLKVENVHFNSDLNGVHKNNFGKINLDETGAQIIEQDYDFDIIHVLREAEISSNELNGINIDRLVEDTVKIDEPFDFKTITFDSAVISKQPVILNGQIERVDFDNIVRSDAETEQIIFGEKTFRSDLTIEGDITYEGNFSGFDFNNLCEFTMQPANQPKNLTIEGNAYFSKGPNVEKINSFNVEDIWENALFRNKESQLNGYVEFDDVIFENDIYIQNFVDNVSLKYLSENYFSKSKNQIITSNLQFLDDLTFDNELSVSEIELTGHVNGINLDEFVRTALLDNYNQVFESEVYIENCNIAELSGDFQVNKLNLEDDVMRYDKMNMITGKKIFGNVIIDGLKLERNINIQGVDVLNWIQNSVLTEGRFNITAMKIFNKNITFENGIIMEGALNNQHFNDATLMLKDAPQDISGRKTIIANNLDPVKFKAIKLKGLLNNIEISELINNQAYKNTDNTFKTALNFNNNVTTNNLIIKKSYQGMNVTDLISNVTNLGALNSLVDNYDHLYDMSLKIKRSVENQAYFLHHYTIMQEIPVMTNSMMILCPDGLTRIGTFNRNASKNKIELYGWHPEKNLFIKDDAINFDMQDLSFIDQVMMGRYFYIEENDDFGHFMRVEDNVKAVLTIPSNNTRDTVSFFNPLSKQTCTLFIYYNCSPRLFCESGDNIELMQVFDVTAHKASPIIISGTPYLAIINANSDKEAPVTLWKFSKESNKFIIHQSMFETEPKSISSITHKDTTFLAIASGHLPNALYSGRIEIKQFDLQTQQFKSRQSWDLDAPIQLEFAILPSSELLLYVLTENPTQPLIVYRYEGIAGFREVVVGSALPRISYFNLFMGGAGQQHFVMAQSYDEMSVIQAVFKGEKFRDG